MSDKLGAIRERMHSVQSLEKVVAAMRGIAAARLREAENHLQGVAAYAATIGSAIAQILPLQSGDRAMASAASSPDTLVIAFLAQQGFVGAMNERVLEKINGITTPSSEIWAFGTRGSGLAQERHLPIARSVAMISHPAEMPQLAEKIMTAFMERYAGSKPTQVHLVYAMAHGAARSEVLIRRLLPFDYSLFVATGPAGKAGAPFLTLPAGALLDQLVEEYLYAQLCEAIICAFTAENQARMEAMVSTSAHVKEQVQALTAEFSRYRQEEITAEIIELSADDEPG